MPSFEVSSSAADPVVVDARNWLSALGEGLHALGFVDGLERLACEVLPNGRVVARDVRTGRGFTVAPAGTVGPSPLPALHDEDTGDTPSAEVFIAGAGDEGDESDEDIGDLATEFPRGPSALEDATDPWRVPGLRDALESPSGATSRVLDRVERVRIAPSHLLAWHEALDAARALVPSEAGATLEREPDGKLRFLYAFGPASSGVQGAVLPPGTGIAGFSVERVASLLVLDTREDPRFCSDFDDVTGFVTRQVICVPVAYEGRVHGCLELLNSLLPSGFDRHQLELVEIVADALAGRLAGHG